MAYANLEDYVDYLQGSTASIPDGDFPFYAEKSSKLMDRLTYGNTKVATVTSDIKNCCCELAEKIYTEPDREINVQSVSNDGYSESYDLTISKDSEYREIMQGYFVGTDIMYAGGILKSRC